MPGSLQAWYSLHDLAALGDREAVLAGEFELAELTRLRPLLHEGRGGRVAATLRCSRGPGGEVGLALHFAAKLSVTCQRCLEPLECALDETVEWIAAETDPGAASDERNVLELDGDRLRPVALLEDELIVALPMAPRHASIDECGGLAQNLRRVLRDRDGEAAGRALEVSSGD